MMNRSWPFLRIAHRGAAGLEPENTMRGIEAALRYPVEMIEIDVRPCADGTLVVVHDDDLRRVAGQPGLVSASTVAELKRYDVGKGEKIPTLDDVLSFLRGRVLVNIDQKADNLAPQLLRSIDRVGKRDETMLSGAALGTFKAMREMAPSIGIALSLDASWGAAAKYWLARHTSAGARGQAGWIQASARRAGVDDVTLDYHLASPGVVKRLHQAGMTVLTWTVDDPATMRALKRAGVDGITSNRPDLLAELT
jgi:glycerophosphoryl diester phosphodiesterase